MRLLLQELLAKSADGAYIVDENQRIVAWNAAAAALLGFEPQAVLGAQCYQVLGGHSEGGCVVCKRGCQPHTAGRRGELAPSFDVQVRTSDGPPRWVNVSVIALPLDDDNADPAALAVVHFFRDIENKKQAQQFAAEVVARASQLRLRETGDSQPADHPPAPTSPLTPREAQILGLLAQGADTATIAATLVIGQVTVRNHIQSILHKLGVHSRLEAVTHARQHHMVE